MSTERAVVYLLPGEAHVAREPSILKTVLGSCVGVTFWSTRYGVGALCHGVLPKCPKAAPASERFRYVDSAIRDLVAKFESLGIPRKEVNVKVFGGADVLTVHSRSYRRPTVGRQNWLMALEVLQEENLCPTASDLGGSAGRAIQFDTATGEVMVRRLTRLSDLDDGSQAAGGDEQ